MPASSTILSEKQLIAAAKAPIVAYNDKKWDAVKAACTADFVYDEVATKRMVKGLEQTLTVWKGWAAALPDSKATFDKAFASGDKVVLEITWRGTHSGALTTANGTIAPTGKKIEMRSCIVCEIAGEKCKAQRLYFDMATMLQQLGVAG